MQIQFLGTSAADGWPGLFCNCRQCETARLLGRKNIRTRTQTAIYADAVGVGDTDEVLLIDLPPDTHTHVVQHGLRLDRIGHLLVTHSHDDHFDPKELSYRRAKFASPAPDFPLHIYGNENVGQRLKNAIADTEELNIQYYIVENFTSFQAGIYTVTPLPALHDPNERCLIYLIEFNGKRILYGTDTGIFPDETFEFIAGKPLDAVTLDCTYCANTVDTAHMGLPDAVDVKRRLDAIGCLKSNTKIILQHFSHINGTCYDAMVELAAPYNMEVSYDGGVFSV